MLKVFISYAHESPEFKESVKKFAIWLNQNGKEKIVVSIDYLFSNKAPREGWQIWMYNQIKKSNVVLVICTPKYLARFLKDEETGMGMGVIFEGAIITTALYNLQLFNDKFIPIIPDEGSAKNVPELLQPFFNHLSFSKNNEQILKAILAENPSLEEDASFVEAISPQEQLENQIVDEIFDTNLKQEAKMFSPIHALIRSFLELSDLQKILIAKNLSAYKESFLKMPPDERDKEILKYINDMNLLSELWNEINNIKPFNLKENPFKK